MYIILMLSVKIFGNDKKKKYLQYKNWTKHSIRYFCNFFYIFERLEKRTKTSFQHKMFYHKKSWYLDIKFFECHENESFFYHFCQKRISRFCHRWRSSFCILKKIILRNIDIHFLSYLLSTLKNFVLCRVFENIIWKYIQRWNRTYD